MKWSISTTFLLGLFALVTCSAVPNVSAIAERRAAFQDRNVAARGYADFLRGRYASLSNDPHMAAVFYAGAAEGNPNDVDLLERAVFSNLIAGDVDTAISLGRGAKDDTISQTSLPRLVLGINAIRSGKHRHARKYLLPETSSQFNDAIARSLIAWTTADKRDTASAIGILDADPSGNGLFDSLTLSTRAFIQLYGEDDAGALETFEDMWRNRIRLASSTEYHARLLAADNRREEAVALLDTFLGSIGQNAAIERLRQNLVTGKTITLTRPDIKEGAAISVYTPAAALAAQTTSDLAGVYFSLALWLDPDLDIARTLWGDALDTANRREDAIRVLSEVPEDSVFYATSRGQIAWAQRREDNNDVALATAKQALDAAPDRNLKIQLGDLFRSLDELNKAAEIFTEILEEDAKTDTVDWRLLYARGTAFEQLDRWQEAERDLVRAFELSPDQPALLNYLGYSWIDRGENLQQGFDMIQRAVELRPNSGFIIDSLGWAHFKLGRFEEAVKHLERAVELEPTDPTLNEHLGDAYWRVGRKLEAGFQWNRTLRLDPENSNIVLIKAKIDDGLDRALAHRSAQNGHD